MRFRFLNGESLESIKKTQLIYLMLSGEKMKKKVAVYMEQAHFETSHLQYNNENALSYTVSLVTLRCQKLLSGLSLNFHRDLDLQI